MSGENAGRRGRRALLRALVQGGRTLSRDGRTPVKIYGQRNTGSNYLQALLERNLEVQLLRGVVPQSVMKLQRMVPGTDLVRDTYFKLTFPWNLGWKHTAVPEDVEHQPACAPDLLFVTLTKHPYSWLLSLYRRPHHLALNGWSSFEEFLMTTWPSVARGHLPHVPSPVDLWNLKNASYLRLARRARVENLRYEDLLADPEAVLEGLVERYGLVRKVEVFENIRASTKGDRMGYEDYRRYYLDEEWREKISDEALRLIDHRLDHELAAGFGYRTSRSPEKGSRRAATLPSR